jgi:hypothetical protein
MIFNEPKNMFNNAYESTIQIDNFETKQKKK